MAFVGMVRGIAQIKARICAIDPDCCSKSSCTDAVLMQYWSSLQYIHIFRFNENKDILGDLGVPEGTTDADGIRVFNGLRTSRAFCGTSHADDARMVS